VKCKQFHTDTCCVTIGHGMVSDRFLSGSEDSAGGGYWAGGHLW